MVKPVDPPPPCKKGPCAAGTPQRGQGCGCPPRLPSRGQRCMHAPMFALPLRAAPLGAVPAGPPPHPPPASPGWRPDLATALGAALALPGTAPAAPGQAAATPCTAAAAAWPRTTPHPPTPPEYARAVERALHSNPSLGSQEAQSKSTEETRKSARGAFRPQAGHELYRHQNR